jgi:hypothetical protein
MLRKGNLITLKDHYHHYPYSKAIFLVLTDIDHPFPTDADAYVKVFDNRGTIFNLPYSQLYMYQAIA